MLRRCPTTIPTVKAALADGGGVGGGLYRVARTSPCAAGSSMIAWLIASCGEVKGTTVPITAADATFFTCANTAATLRPR
jgi:hypothetical protein